MIRNLSNQNQQARQVDGVTPSPDSLASGEPDDRFPSVGGSLAMLKFHRDLPQFLQEHAGQWIAYRGDHRLGFAATKTKLYQECLRRGLTADEFAVFCVEPEMPELIEVNWPPIG